MTVENEKPDPAATGSGNDGACTDSGTDAKRKESSDGHIPRNFMVEFGPRLLDQGYHIVPIMPGAKKPGEFLGKHWKPQSDWTRYGKRQQTDLEMSHNARWPGCGVGIICGSDDDPVIGLDLDLPEQQTAEGIEQMAFRDLGETPAIRIGLAPKRLLVYRTKVPIKPVKRHPLEILSTGNQFVGYGIHPGTGRPYAWPVEDLVDIHVSDLPVVDERALHAFLEKAYPAIPAELRPKTLGHEAGTGSRSAEGLRGDREAIADAMAFIRNEDLPYSEWIDIALALKGGLGEDGWPLFEAFSAQSTKNNAACNTWTIWKGLRPHSKGAGTIYHLAQLNGWKPPAGLHFNEGKRAAAHAVDGLIRSLTSRRSAGRKPALPSRTVRTRQEAESVFHALESISATGRTYPQWNAVCRALHAAFGERGRAIWVEWASGSTFGDPGRHFDLISKGVNRPNWDELLRLAREMSGETAHG